MGSWSMGRARASRETPGEGEGSASRAETTRGTAGRSDRQGGKGHKERRPRLSRDERRARETERRVRLLEAVETSPSRRRVEVAEDGAVSTITALEPEAQGTRTLVRVNGRGLATVLPAMVESLGLAVGRSLTHDLALALGEAQAETRALDAGLMLLSVSGRSRRALSDRLTRQDGHDPEPVERALDRLVAMGVLDDTAYAESLARSAVRSKGHGRRRVVAEMRRRGVDDDTAQGALDEAMAEDPDGEYDRALAVGRKKWPSLQREAPRDRSRRLWGFLARRGYDGETIRRVLAALAEGAEVDAGDDGTDGPDAFDAPGTDA